MSNVWFWTAGLWLGMVCALSGKNLERWRGNWLDSCPHTLLVWKNNDVMEKLHKSDPDANHLIGHEPK